MKAQGSSLGSAALEGVGRHAAVHRGVGVTTVEAAVVAILAKRFGWREGLRSLHGPVVHQLGLATGFFRQIGAICVRLLIGEFLLHVL